VTTPPTLSVNVIGTPVPQPRPRVAARGRHAHAYVPAKHPIHHWRLCVRTTMDQTLEEREMEGAYHGLPLLVSLHFTIARPKSQYRASLIGNPLKPSAPAFPTGARTGDLDNLAKGVLDALEGALFVNDSWVVDLRVSKGYVDPRYSMEPGCTIVVTPKVPAP
jgi:Holliday junction resolvase RusA-like endonuclease